jgi:hypothetical protein
MFPDRDRPVLEILVIPEQRLVYACFPIPARSPAFATFIAAIITVIINTRIRKRAEAEEHKSTKTQQLKIRSGDRQHSRLPSRKTTKRNNRGQDRIGRQRVIRLTQVAMPIGVLRTGGGVEVDDRVDPVFGALFGFVVVDIRSGGGC